MLGRAECWGCGIEAPLTMTWRITPQLVLGMGCPLVNWLHPSWC